MPVVALERPGEAPRLLQLIRNHPEDVAVMSELVDGLTLTSHHFMSPEELRTDLGQERLAACVFRLPYKGEMVPMCRMNAGGVRDQLYAEILADAEACRNQG